VSKNGHNKKKAKTNNPISDRCPTPRYSLCPAWRGIRIYGITRCVCVCICVCGWVSLTREQGTRQKTESVKVVVQVIHTSSCRFSAIYKRASRTKMPSCLAYWFLLACVGSMTREGWETYQVVMHHGEVIARHVAEGHLVDIKILVPAVRTEV